MNRKRYHVVPYERSWLIRLENRPDPLSFYSTKENAVSSARMLARQTQPSQVFVHGKDGKIQEEYTYGDDPHNSPG